MLFTWRMVATFMALGVGFVFMLTGWLVCCLVNHIKETKQKSHCVIHDSNWDEVL